ncbi:hypothetical protein CL618_01020 [archaeon]|nr:hypothetical protein [archaeon]|tara:strand:+ start:1403 stop:3175 length:1773 start_codon:yes stop_codon:yes gene_type:complete
MLLKRGLLILILILLISTVSALEVRLSEPENNTTITTNSIQFQCKSFQTGSEILTNLTLYIFPENAPTWHSSTKTATDDTLIEFQANIPINGIYSWNCLAKNSNNEEFFASTNRTFTLGVNTNTNPTIQTIPDQIKDSLDSWSIDFTQYESDQEDSGPDLDWSVSDFDTNILNIEVTDSDGDTITFTPITYGTTTANFTLTDSGNLKDSQIITITLNNNTQSNNSNNPPTILTIPDQNMTGLDSWKVDLTEYEEDDEDSSQNLKWSVSGIDTSLHDVEVTDEEDDEITFTPKDYGSDTITLTLTDSDGDTASQSIKVTINEESNEIEESFDDEEPETKLIDSFTPTNKNIKITIDEMLTFSITTFEKTNIKWILNGDQQGTNDLFFLNTNNLDNQKEYQLTANVKRGSTEEEIIWTITKELTNIEIPEEELEETKEDSTNQITGFAVSDTISKITDSKTTIIILIILAIIIIILIILYFLNKKGILKNIKFKKKPSVYKDIKLPKDQKTLKDLTIKPEPIKEEFDVTKFVKKQPKKPIMSNLLEIKAFIRKRQSWGETEEMIKQKLSKNYSQEDIDKAYEELKKQPLFRI